MTTQTRPMLNIGLSKRHHTPEYKLQVVLETLQQDTTIEQVCRNHNLAPSVIHRWRKTFRQKGSVIFDEQSKLISNRYPLYQSPDELKRIIGSVTVENEILKKALGCLT